ncbi:hypothetical protein Y032_0384g408 [Ancylostoma ceylanicum]|uniref:Uncharacterized protein n=1 Tax=Ancylostoma ceylanicum TaxID=53326 RepID=A0A016RTJ1_9BILA|nr:hypothetical protein Y032_0384g408 [Ancylostoma ceylanicum]
MCTRRKRAAGETPPVKSFRAVLTAGKKVKAIGMDSGSLCEENVKHSEEVRGKTKPSNDLGGAAEEKKPQAMLASKPEPQDQQPKSQGETGGFEHAGEGYENFGPPQESAPEDPIPPAALEAAALRTALPAMPVVEGAKQSEKSRQRRKSTIERLFPDKTQDNSGKAYMAKALRATKRAEVAV